MSGVPEPEIRVLARVLAFLWPERWTSTRRGLVLCIIATFSLGGAAVGVLVGVCLTAAGIGLWPRNVRPAA